MAPDTNERGNLPPGYEKRGMPPLASPKPVPPPPVKPTGDGGQPKGK